MLTPSDKSNAPSYDRKRIPGDEDTELLVFRAGPPYEDVAFRIVRKQWDYSHRRGFRSHFDRGVLQRECECWLEVEKVIPVDRHSCGLDMLLWLSGMADSSGVQVPARHVSQVVLAGVAA